MPLGAARIGAVALIAVTLASLGQQPVLGQTPTPGTTATPDAASVRQLERTVLIWVSTILSAEKAYAAANGSFFGELACLMAPVDCIPGFPSDAASFLDPTYKWLQPALGYSRKFHPGAKAGADEIRRKNASTSSLKAFAFTAAPLKPGESGTRAFCGDSTGRLCFTPDGTEPPVKDGRCEPCRKLH